MIKRQKTNNGPQNTNTEKTEIEQQVPSKKWRCSVGSSCSTSDTCPVTVEGHNNYLISKF